MVAIADPEDRIAWMTIGDEDWKDYTVSVRAKTAKHQPRQNSGESTGLVFRFQNPLNWYSVGLGTFGLSPPIAFICYIQNNFSARHRENKPFGWKLNNMVSPENRS